MKYQIIYTDPPWKYRVYDESDAAHGAATSHYPTMSLDELKALPIQKIADKNCALFMWVTPPLLPEGIELMQAWGFRYVTKAFNWVKLNGSGTLWMGLGHYTRGNSEDCLLGIKGSLPRADAGVAQVVLDYDLPETITTYRVEHSKKPDETRDRIVRLFGDLPRVELFSRQKRQGWDVLGNGIDGRDIRESLEEVSNEQRVAGL